MELTPKVEFLGLTFDLTILIGSTVAAVIVFLITFMFTRKREMVPSGVQNIIEYVIEFTRGISQMNFNDRQAEKVLGFTFTIFLFIFVSNQMGVIFMAGAEIVEPIPEWGLTKEVIEESGIHEVNLFKSPTADLSVTLAMAISIMLASNLLGIRSNFKGYIKHFVSPLGLIHIVEEFSKPLTHAMRLWANIFAGEILIFVMLTKGPILLTGAPLLVWMGFSLFVGTIQAYIFTVLANVFLAQKINPDH